MAVDDPQDWRDSLIAKRGDTLLTDDGETLIYLSGLPWFQCAGRKYFFSDVMAFQERIAEPHRAFVVTDRWVFMRIEVGVQVFVINQSQNHDPGYTAAMHLHDNLLWDRRNRLLQAYVQGQRLSFPIQHSHWLLEVWPNEGMVLRDARNQDTQVIERITLRERWLRIKTPQGSFDFGQASISDLASWPWIPECVEQVARGDRLKRRFYWMESLFLYAVLLNGLFGIYPAPNGVVQVIYILLSFWAIVNIYSQIAALVWRPLMVRVNRWTRAR